MKYIVSCLTLALLSFGFASCDKKEDIEAPKISTETPLPDDERWVDVDLSSVVAGEDQLRFSYADRDFYSTSGIDQATGRAKVYPIMEEKNLNILVVARQAGGKTIPNILEFKKVANQRRVEYKGRIKVPNSNQNQVELAAIVLSEVGGRTFVNFDSQTKKARVVAATTAQPAVDGIISTNVPYLARWTPVNVLADATSVTGWRLSQATTLHFKPSGSLLRMDMSYDRQSDNSSNPIDFGSGSVTIVELEVKTNAFYLNWEYDIETLGNAPSMVDNTLADGQRVDRSTLDRHFHLPIGITLQGGATSPGYFIWVMPRSQADKSDADLRTDFILHISDGVGNTTTQRRRISTRLLPVTGGSQNINLGAHYGKEVRD